MDYKVGEVGTGRGLAVSVLGRWFGLETMGEAGLGFGAKGVEVVGMNNLCLVEICYNKKLAMIASKAAPFELLYGRKCRAPICLDEVGERLIEGPELIEITNEKVAVAKEKLKEARSRQKSYADKHKRDLEFQVGDRVFLKVLPIQRSYNVLGSRASQSSISLVRSEILERLGRGCLEGQGRWEKYWKDCLRLGSIGVRSRGSDFDIPVVFSLTIALLRNKDAEAINGFNPNVEVNGGIGERNTKRNAGGGQQSLYTRMAKLEFTKFSGEDVGYLGVNSSLSLIKLLRQTKYTLSQSICVIKLFCGILNSLRVKGYETTAREYEDAFDDLLSRIKIREDHAISLFMGGLPVEIAMGVGMFKPRKLDDAYCLTNLQETTLNAVKKKNRKQVRIDDDDDVVVVGFLAWVQYCQQKMCILLEKCRSEGVKKEDLYGDNGKEQATNKMNLSSQALFNYALMAISSFKLISSSDMSCVLSPKLNKDSVIIEDWTSDDEEEVSEVQKVRPENQTVKSRDDKSGQNSHKTRSWF
ncbi:hypothetical protein Tco_0109588 [Tanacetum coccineum]